MLDRCQVRSMPCLPLTFRFSSKYARMLGSIQEHQVFELATDLALSTFNLCASEFPSDPSVAAMRKEADVSPYAEAALALKEFMSLSPETFVSNEALAAIGGE